MESQALIELMKQVEEKGIGWDKVQEQTKVPHQLLNLYSRSGPVPVTLINKIKTLLEKGDQ